MRHRDSLAGGGAEGPPGTLHALSTAGRIEVRPEHNRVVRFGRNDPRVDPEVHLRVGHDDMRVSRRHGELTYRQGHWWLRNLGQQLVRLPQGRMLHTSTDPVPLAGGYTPLFVKGSGDREHLVELYVTGEEPRRGQPAPGAPTIPPKRWEITEEERVLLVIIGQEYLRYEPDPRPRAYKEAEAVLAYLPFPSWNRRKIERKMGELRRRLEQQGTFPYKLMREDEAGPCDNNLLHNLLKGLVESTTLVPPDLALLDDDLDA
ncbi:FHA domain-containing protein [Streptomyces hoynatensis]|uniref:FHA domain-containing protein n=1 Tax=Streptomyces hoynatensis TaxID=1141874 RepID=A0A3A9YWY3_9ACTN|nr:FHA domain-containing protein [Streptomyces hoynatensis]RKN40400.1 FHA domain-containing protein [Streptomyces hoynatensis]